MINVINQFVDAARQDQLILSNFVSQFVNIPGADNTQVLRAKIVIDHYSDVIKILNQVVMSYPDLPESEAEVSQSEAPAPSEESEQPEQTPSETPTPKPKVSRRPRKKS